MQEAIDFLDETTALASIIDRAIEASDETQVLETMTAFKGWTVGDIVTHLNMWNEAASLTIIDPAGFQDFLAKFMDGIQRFGSMRGFEDNWAEVNMPAPLQDWKQTARRLATLVVGEDPLRKVEWAGPPMTVRSAIIARLMETWAHGQAIYDVFGLKREDTDRIKGICELGVKTYGWSFRVRGMDAPGACPRVALSAPSGDSWLWNGASQSGLVEGSATEFCQVVTQTRNVMDTSLKVVGGVAEAWMLSAQCFAGPPEKPPAVGVRKRLGEE